MVVINVDMNVKLNAQFVLQGYVIHVNQIII